MRNPLRTQGGVTGLGKKGLADKGGSARPEFTGVSRVGCSGHGQGLHLAQKGFVARGVLTAHGRGWRLGAATPAARLSGGSRTALVEVGAAGRSGLLGSADRLLVMLRQRTNGQGGRSIHGGEKSRWRSHLPAVVLGVESGACRALGRGRRARGVSWGSGGAMLGVVEARGAVEGRGRGGAALCSARRSCAAWRS